MLRIFHSVFILALDIVRLHFALQRGNPNDPARDCPINEIACNVGDLPMRESGSCKDSPRRDSMSMSMVSDDSGGPDIELSGASDDLRVKDLQPMHRKTCGECEIAGCPERESRKGILSGRLREFLSSPDFPEISGTRRKLGIGEIRENSRELGGIQWGFVLPLI